MAKSRLGLDNPMFTANEELKQEEPKKRTVGRPRNPKLVRVENGGSSAQAGLTKDLKRFTVIANVQAVNDLRDYAYTRRLTLKDAFNEIMEKFIEDYKNNPNNEKLLVDPKRKANE